jgi:type IV secretion system protein TrbL
MNFNLLTTVLSTFLNALASGQARVQSAGSGVLKGLAIIEIVLACLWMAMDDTSLSAPFKKLLQLSFWFWFSTHFPSLVHFFADSLVQVGLSAGGQSGNIGLLLDPSKIAGMALDATQPLVQSMHDAGLTHIADIFMLGFCYAALILCFFVIACQICLAVIEYYLVVTMATCLIPFGMSSHTKFIAEKAIGASVAVSVKLMVLSFIMGLMQPVLGQIHFTPGGELSMNEALSMVLVCGLLAYVVWRAPGFAADLLAASPSLSAAAVGQTVTTAVSSGASAFGGAVTGGLAAGKLVRDQLGGKREGTGGGGGGGGGSSGGAGGALRHIASAISAGARAGGSFGNTSSGGAAGKASSSGPSPSKAPSASSSTV